MNVRVRKGVIIPLLAAAAAVGAAAWYVTRERTLTNLDPASLHLNIGRRVEFKGVVTDDRRVLLYHGTDPQYFLNGLLYDMSAHDPRPEIPPVGHEVLVTGRIANFNPQSWAGSPPDRSVVLSGIGIRDLGLRASPAPAHVAAVEPALSINVTAAGYRWWFEYAGARVSNELHLPESGAVLLRVTSSDVIHAMHLSLPGDFVDAIPGHVKEGRVPGGRKAGQYKLFCGELCGPRHWECGATIVVEGDGEFKRWLAQLPATRAATTQPHPAATQPAGRAGAHN